MLMMMDKQVLHWGGVDNGNMIKKVVDRLWTSGVAVTPTRVGYIMPCIDAIGLDRMFALKGRAKSKPGVVLAISPEHVFMLAQTSDKIRQLYERCYGEYQELDETKSVLLGCILPWHPRALSAYVKEDCWPMMSDRKPFVRTSCFVIRYGIPSEAVAHNLWAQHGKLTFASSANPSKQGNRGELAGVGSKILDGVDVILEADAYVKKQQPAATAETRWEQGVMVSFVDKVTGFLTDTPRIIRHGHQLEQVRGHLTAVFGFFEDAHGDYY
mgnify:CR=1 FL=1